MKVGNTTVFRYGVLFYLVFAHFAAVGEEEQRAFSKDGKASIQLPTGWSSKNEFSSPSVKVAIFSPLDGKEDQFHENVLILADPLKPGQTIDDYLKEINADQKTRRPDFTVLEETGVKVDGIPAKRLICRMTFPEFVSKNIQYALEFEGAAYTITASIPEGEFAKWEKLMDQLALSVRFQPPKK